MNAVNHEIVARTEHIAFLVELAKRRLTEELARIVDLTPFPELRGSHMRLLTMIPLGGARPTALAELAQVSKQALGQMVAHLEEHAYVSTARDPADRRALIVRHTPRGEAAREAALAGIAELERRWAAEVGAARFEVVRAVLAQLVARRAPR